MHISLIRPCLCLRVVLILLLCISSADVAFASEGAVRECCEPMSPTPSFSTAELQQDYYTSTEVLQTGDYLEVNESGIVTLNCIMAKQVCMDDPMCGPTLDIVDRVCGSEVVSCSTVTVTKCQAALKTLQTFPFFNPTCLCREPQLDQKCNSFRTFLFDHPCLFANRREKDPYPIDSLVSCTHAHSICRNDANCSRIYDHFKHVCRTNEEEKCIPELQESCKESWSKIRLTPMFGCICPPNLWQGQKKCDRHFNFVNHNRCAGSDLPIETNDVLTNFKSTCAQAMEMCEKTLKCATAISAIMANCNKYMCKRNECQRSLQAFYRDKSLVKYAVEVAFCLCKKTNNSEENACMEAQDTLHPACAQEVDSISLPACHTVASGCRSDPECGPLLEEFEQLCAADNYTKTCAGHPAQCRIGMLGILGTKLRSHCVCKGTDRAKLYECMGWQRVLWFNPCVVEAQREFHMNKVRARLLSRNHNVTSIYDEVITTVPAVTETRIVATTVMTTPTTLTTQETNIPIATTTTITKRTTSTARTITTTTSTITVPLFATTEAVSSTTTTTPNTPSTTPILLISTATQPNTKIFRKYSYNNGLSNAINRGREKSAILSTHSPTNIFLTQLAEGNHRIIFEKSSTTATTRRPVFLANSKTRPKTTIPPNVPGCILQKTSLDDEMFVPEGKATRFYHDFENDCSEMCYCTPGSLLRCQTECIQPQSCKTDIALYKHGAPAYQAFRGRCLCYSAKFICIRPKSGTYSIPPGVFLYLGYSSIDERLMKKHINFEMQDSVNEFQYLLDKKIIPEASCHLSLFSVAEENAIFIAKYKNISSNAIRQINIKPTLEEITKDRESCISGLEYLAKTVNEQHYDIKTNVFLSIFKLGEVDVTYPEESSLSIRNSISRILIFLPFSIYKICCY